MTKLAKYFWGQCHFWIAFSALSALLLSSEFLLLGFEGFDEVNLDWGELILGTFAEFLILSVGFQFCYFCRYTSGMCEQFFPDSVRKSSSFLIQSFIYIGTWLFCLKFGKVKIEVDYAIEHINFVL